MARVDSRPPIEGGIGQSLAHDSAHKHVSGEAIYLDDIPTPADCLSVYIAYSSHAHAQIKNLDLTAVKTCPGVVAVLSVADIPGINDVSPIFGDDPIFADSLVEYASKMDVQNVEQQLNDAKKFLK